MIDIITRIQFEISNNKRHIIIAERSNKKSEIKTLKAINKVLYRLLEQHHADEKKEAELKVYRPKR